METLKRKGNNCEYIKIHFDNETEYNAVIDCLTRAAMLIGESFSEDVDSHLELVKMIEKTKMVYENGTVSALIFNDFTEKLFLHCWDLSILTCKHANLYQPEQLDNNEPLATETKMEEPPIEEVKEELPTDSDNEIALVSDETVDIIIDNNDIEIEEVDIIEKQEEEPAMTEEQSMLEDFAAYESIMTDILSEEAEDVTSEMIEKESNESLGVTREPIPTNSNEVIDLLEETTVEEHIENPVIEDVAMEETTMCELEVDESVLVEIEQAEIENEELEEEVLRKAAFEAESIRLEEEANAKAAEIYARMISGDPEPKQTNKFMKRFNKLFKK